MKQSNSKRTRRKFTAEFKQNVVDLVARGEKSVQQVCRDLDLTESAVRRWVRLAEQSRGGSPGVARGRERGAQAPASRESPSEAGARNPGKGGGLLRQGVDMRFAFVDAEKANYSVALLCRMMQVSRSGYYAWISRPPSQHELDDSALLEQIRRVFEASRKTYGSPRVQRQLRKDCIVVGHNRVARLMRENGLAVKPRKGYRNTTERNEAHPVAPNVIQRDFTATEPGQKWVGDVTAVSTGEG